MEKKFRVLRIIGTLWKVLAWITLIGGILLSFAILLGGILGSGAAIPLFRPETRFGPTASIIVSSVVGFIFGLIITALYFLILYAVGELIYLLLAIERNTRQTVQLMQGGAPEEAEQVSPQPVSSS